MIHMWGFFAVGLYFLCIYHIHALPFGALKNIPINGAAKASRENDVLIAQLNQEEAVGENLLKFPSLLAPLLTLSPLKAFTGGLPQMLPNALSSFPALDIASNSYESNSRYPAGVDTTDSYTDNEFPNPFVRQGPFFLKALKKSSIIPPLPGFGSDEFFSNADEWLTAVANLQDALTRTGSNFFENLSAAQQAIIHTLIPANAILNALNIPDPVLEPTLALLQYLAPSQFALLRAFIPAPYLAHLSDLVSTAGETTTTGLGQLASAALSSVGVEGAKTVNSERKPITLTTLDPTNIEEALKVDSNAANELSKIVSGLSDLRFGPFHALDLFVQSPFLTETIARRLLDVEISRTESIRPDGFDAFSFFQKLVQTVFLYDTPAIKVERPVDAVHSVEDAASSNHLDFYEYEKVEEKDNANFKLIDEVPIDNKESLETNLESTDNSIESADAFRSLRGTEENLN